MQLRGSLLKDGDRCGFSERRGRTLCGTSADGTWGILKGSAAALWLSVSGRRRSYDRYMSCVQTELQQDHGADHVAIKDGISGFVRIAVGQGLIPNTLPPLSGFVH
jgi:hypothetical protein